MGGWRLEFELSHLSFFASSLSISFMNLLVLIWFWFDFMFDWMDFCSFLSFVICKFFKNLVFRFKKTQNRWFSKWNIFYQTPHSHGMVMFWCFCLVKVGYQGWPQASYWWESPHSGFVDLSRVQIVLLIK